MRRRDCIKLVGVGVVSAIATRTAFSQDANQLPLIAMLIGLNAAISSARFFLAGLADLGYEESKNYRLAARYAEQRPERLTPLAEELVRLHPTVIFADDVGSALPASKITSSIPIVSAMLGDPVKAGLVKSLARPGGNVTGLSSDVEGLVGKQMEIAVQAVPGAALIGLLLETSYAGWNEQRTEADAAAQRLGISLIVAEAENPADLTAAFEQISKSGAQVAVVPASPLFVGQRRILVALAATTRLPVIYSFPFFAEDGGYISYGVRATDNFRRAARFVDKILKGAKPGDLPIEFPTKLDLVINLKTASALGLTVPPLLFARADEVIE